MHEGSGAVTVEDCGVVVERDCGGVGCVGGGVVPKKKTIGCEEVP